MPLDGAYCPDARAIHPINPRTSLQADSLIWRVRSHLSTSIAHCHNISSVIHSIYCAAIKSLTRKSWNTDTHKGLPHKLAASAG